MEAKEYNKMYKQIEDIQEWIFKNHKWNDDVKYELSDLLDTLRESHKEYLRLKDPDTMFFPNAENDKRGERAVKALDELKAAEPYIQFNSIDYELKGEHHYFTVKPTGSHFLFNWGMYYGIKLAEESNEKIVKS